MSSFYNPYDFIPATKPTLENVTRAHLTGDTPPDHQHLTYDRYVADAGLEGGSSTVYSGRVLCRLHLDTPTVIGAARVGELPAVVRPFEIDGEPAIPDSSLRGMISSVVEAATSSALRVLTDTPLTMRMDTARRPQESDILHAIGMIVVREGKRSLLPLAFPLLTKNGNAANLGEPWRRWAQVRLKVYVNDVGSLPSFSPDNFSVCFLRDAPTEARAGSLLTASDPNFKGPWLVGQHLLNGQLITRDTWIGLAASEQAKYSPGLLRRLRNGDPDRDKAMPRNLKKHEWFLPLSNGIYDPKADAWKDVPDLLLDAEKAAKSFEAMAVERTRRNLTLPFEVAQSERNNIPLADRAVGDAQDHAIRLRHGDLVCFKLVNSEIDSLAISAIWRRPAGDVREWFSNIDGNLAPMTGARNEITLAEQLFGFVQEGDSPAGTDPLPNLAGRVRFSDARLIKPAPQPYLPATILQILAGPKPPSPPLYFKRARGGRPSKNAFPHSAEGSHVPLGRKVYLHHAPANASWETRKPDKDLKQKVSVTPLKQGLEFCFSVSFDNEAR